MRSLRMAERRRGAETSGSLGVYALALAATLGLAGLASRTVIAMGQPRFERLAAARAATAEEAALEAARASQGDAFEAAWRALMGDSPYADGHARALRDRAAGGAGRGGDRDGGGAGDGVAGGRGRLGGPRGGPGRGDGGEASAAAVGAAAAGAGAATSTTAAAEEAPPERGELQGVVVDRDRIPVAGATVRVLAGGRRYHETKCDAEGRFAIPDVREGRYNVFARATGFREGRVSGNVDLAAGQSRRDLVVTLQRAGAITGRVTDAAGEPIAGATVRVRYGGAFGSIGARTDRDGRYTLKGAKPGRNDLTAIHADYLDSKVRIVRIAAGEDGEAESVDGIDFTLEQGGGVAGWVVAFDGAVHGALVELRDRRDRVLERVRTDGGRFRFDGLVKGSYKVRAGPVDGAVALASLNVPAKGDVEITLELDPGGTLGGIVMDGADEPEGGVLVRADRHSVAHRVEGRSRADGVFELAKLPDGRYTVRAFPSGAQMAPEPIVVEIQGGLGPQDLVFRVPEGALLAGRVLAEDGGPAGGAILSVHDAGYRQLVSVRVEPDGTFRAPRLAAGEVHVFARLGAELVRERMTLALGDTTGVTLILHRMGEARGRVVGEDGTAVAGADIVVTSDDGIVRRTARTDKNGAWRVRDLYPGPYVATAKKGSQRGELRMPVLPRESLTDLEVVIR